MRPASLSGAAMDVCVENVFTTPAIEAINVIQATAEEENRGAETPRYKDAGQEAEAQSNSPASPSETPRTEVAAEKNPWSAWAWLGLCRTREDKNLGPKGPSCNARIPNIVHVDVDAFFASVEQVLNPKLRGKPVLVGRGCVASASYEAKFRGVKTAMSFREALRICPQAIVVPGQYEHYADFAERVRHILETYTPAVETAALDDFYLDFAGTERLYPDYEATLRRLQAEIFGRTGLNVSIGAARTKVVASIASRLERPPGFRMVTPGEEETFLTPLPVEQLHGIGHRIRYVDHFAAPQTVRVTNPTNDERELLASTKDLFGKLFSRRGAVRLAGVGVHTLESDNRQHELFDPNANRRWYLNRGLDSVRDRYGWNSVFYGKGLELREHYATKPNGLVLSTPCLSR